MNDQGELKRRVAAAAADLVHSGSRVGLGSGSTVNLVVAALAERVRRGELRDLFVVAASTRTATELGRCGLPINSLDEEPVLDLAIDGADEIDGQFAMIKGGGGALLRERIVLVAAAERIIVVDRSKVVPVLGSGWAVPVEVVRWGWRVAERALRSLGARPVRRTANGAAVLTDEGNYLLDCAFGTIADPATLAARIAGQAGVVAHGIFVDLADRVLIAGVEGIEERVKGSGPASPI